MSNFNTFSKHEHEHVDALIAALDASYDGIHILDKDGYTLMINKACERIEGISAKDVQSKNIRQLVDEGYFSESVTLKVLEKKEPITIMQKVKNGNEVLVTGVPVYKDGEIDKVIVNSRDITQLNNLKRELHKHELLLEKYHEEWQKLSAQLLNNNKIVCESRAMRRIFAMALNVAKVDSNVLVTGESGAGKGLICKVIHDNSNKSKGAFIKIDCGTIPESLFESELFGFEKGTFTGADSKGRVGLAQLAHKGTLFLDEIGDVPLSVQMKLRRLVEEKVIFRVGGQNPIPVEARIIAATNKDLSVMVKEGTFREDLYFRLNVIHIEIPPLRERKDDIHMLVINTLNRLNEKYKTQKKITAIAMDKLIEYNWPGNVRELENVIERSYVLNTTQSIDLIDLPSAIKAKTSNQIVGKDTTLRSLIADYEKGIFAELLAQECNAYEIARKLGIDVTTARRKMQKYGLKLK